MTNVLVTGASSGIGAATVRHLAEAGYRVWAAMRNPAGDHEVPDGLDIAELDVTDPESVARCFAALDGQVDVLVNNAGIGYNAVTEDVDIARAQQLFDTNLWGAVRCIQQVLPAMRARGRGTIVNMSSIAGRLPLLGQVPYCMSKFALEAMSLALAQEVARFGVRVALIEPGVVASRIFAKNTDFPSPTAYAWAYRRETQFYLAGIVAGRPADHVARTVQAAIESPTVQLRWPCGWAGPELTGRAEIDDDAWLALGTVCDDDYATLFAATFGVDLDMERGRR